MPQSPQAGLQRQHLRPPALTETNTPSRLGIGASVSGGVELQTQRRRGSKPVLHFSVSAYRFRENFNLGPTPTPYLCSSLLYGTCVAKDVCLLPLRVQ